MKKNVKTMVTLVMVLATWLVGTVGLIKVVSLNVQDNVQTNPNQEYFEQLSYGAGTVAPMPEFQNGVLNLK